MHTGGQPSIERPLGVWLLTAFDFLVPGLVAIVLDGIRIFHLLAFEGPALGRPAAGLFLGIQAMFVVANGLLLLWSVAICLAAYKAWAGNERARVILAVLVTIRALFLTGADGVIALATIPVAVLHWWYFWRPNVLEFFR
jgi:hypothetical protein